MIVLPRRPSPDRWRRRGPLWVRRERVTGARFLPFALPISATNLTSGADETDGPWTTASITPGANRLILAAFYARHAGGTPSASLSGNGLTWVQIANINWAPAAAITLYLFRSMGASPSTGAITISFGAAVVHGVWIVDEIASVDTTGTNGSGAVVQSATNSADAASLTVTLAAFGSADNGTYGTFAQGGSQTITPGTGFTELAEIAPANGLAMNTEWRNDNDTTVDASWAVGTLCGGIAIEIKFAAAGGATTPLRTLLGVGT